MLRGLEDLVREYARDINETAVEELVADIARVTPFDTGELADSFEQESTHESGSTFSTTIGYSADHAGYTDEGVREHVIEPSSARVLSFFWPDGPDGAKTYSFDFVNHPGIERTGWFTDTVETWPEVVAEAVDA